MRLAAWVSIVALTACGSSTSPDAAPSLTTVAVIPASRGVDLDLLFVIDNTGTMAARQTSLSDAFPSFIDSLTSRFGVMPNLHVGVISTDVGTYGVAIGGCSSPSRPAGDDGNLLTSGCTGVTDAFISDVAAPDGSRARNYDAELPALFTCMAHVGTVGCGFEQPLESLYRALQPGKNPGFLRDDALLAVVILSDEDDCSAASSALFGDPNGTVTSALGPRTSFRCFEFGVGCTGDANPRALGPRTGCVPRVGAVYINDVPPYVEFVQALKPSGNDIVVAGLVGDVDAEHSATVIADPDDPTRPALGTSCTSTTGTAVPAFRLQSFVGAFPDRHAVTTICSASFTDQLTAVAQQIDDAAGGTCLDRALADGDAATPGVQPTCEVTQTTGSDQVVLPSCEAGPAPCWRIAPDVAACPSAPGNLELDIDRGGTTVPPDTTLELRCAIAG